MIRPALRREGVNRYASIVADPPWPYKAPGQFGCTLEHTVLGGVGSGHRL